MDKNKSRTDLLAAGRKKLQQFRQKKDGKGSSSQGKKKSTKSEQHESDVDEVLAATEPTALLLPEGESTSHIDSHLGAVDSNSMESSLAPEIDVPAGDLSSETITPESGIIETPPVQLQPQEPGVSDVASLVPYEVESTQTVDAEEARAVPLATIDNTVLDRETKDTVIFVVADVPTPSRFIDTIEEGTFTFEMDNAYRKERLESLASHEMVLDTSLIQARGYQEADGSGLKQCDRSSEPELKGDGKSNLLELRGGDAILEESVSGATGVYETNPEEKSTSNADEVPASTGAANTSDGFSAAALDSHEADGILAMSHQVIDPLKDVVAGLHNEEKSEMCPVHGGNNSYEGVQADTVNLMVAEADNQRCMPEDSLMTDGKAQERSLEKEMVPSSEITASSVGDGHSISHLQLKEIVKVLSKDEFRSLLDSRGSVSNAVQGTGSLILPDYAVQDSFERLKEELYITNFMKDIFYLQVTEMSGLQMEFDHHYHQLVDELSLLQASLCEIQEKRDCLAEKLAHCRSELQAVVSRREELEDQVHSVKEEAQEFSARAHELQNSLERSLGDLTSLSMELGDCKGLVSSLQVENQNLSGTLASLTEDRNKLVEEKESCLHETEKLSMELAECKGLIAALQSENSNLSGIHALLTEERKKFEEEKESLANENEKMSMELTDCKGLVAALWDENTELNGSLASVKEERKKLEEGKESLASENEKIFVELTDSKGLVAALVGETAELKESLAFITDEGKKLEEKKGSLVFEIEKISMELADCKGLVAALQVENASLKESFAMSLEERSKLEGDKEFFVRVNKRLSSELLVSQEKFPTENGEFVRDGGISSPMLKKSSLDGLAGELALELQEFFDDTSVLAVLKGRFEEAETILEYLEKAIERMHSESTMLNRSSSKVSSPGVSKLIQAVESKAHHDEDEAEGNAVTEGLSLADSLMSIKELTGKLGVVLLQLHLDAETAKEELKKISIGAVRKHKVDYDALKEHSGNLEATNIELGVMYEAVNQHASAVEARNDELQILVEDLKKQDLSLKAEYREVSEKVSEYQSRVSELLNQLHDSQRSSDEKASMLECQVERLQKEASVRTLILEQEWNSTITQIVETVGRLEEFIGRVSASAISANNYDDLDANSRTAASVNATIKVIEDLQEKLIIAHADHETVCNSYKETNEKFNDLLRKNESALALLHMIYGDIRKLVIDSSGSVDDELLMDIQVGALSDPIDYIKYKTILEQLEKFLVERLHLQYLNNELNSELITRTNDIEEFKRNYLHSNAVQKLIDNVESVIKLENTEVDLDKTPVSLLELLVPSLVQRYKEVGEQVRSSREEFGSMEMELTELQEKIYQLNTLNLQHETEVVVLKASLRQAEEALAFVRSELREKVIELERSEQRVSSIREKLGIAVAKGKGLVVQRDGLKQSLAETSKELEKCAQELQLRDARLHELETKLKTYMEAGERVEALESELSYIRNSATTLRESFLLKDLALQRVEEILEDLDLPEQFHSRDIIEKVDWLARSATGNSLSVTDWDQNSSVGGSCTDTGFVVTDARREDAPLSSSLGDDMRRKYEELQSKFYGLAEQNEMLEQSLMERNHLVQRWEELLNRINMPSHLQSMEPEDRIEWLGTALLEANHDRSSIQQKIDNLEDYCQLVTTEESQKRISELEANLKAVIHEREHLSERMKILTSDHEKVLEQVLQFELEKEKLQSEMTGLQDKLEEKVGIEERIHSIEGELSRLEDLVCDALRDCGAKELVSVESSTTHLEVLLRKLIAHYPTLSMPKAVVEDAVDEHRTEQANASLDKSGSRDVLISEEIDVAGLKNDLEDALRNLMHVKEERDIYMDKQQSLILEVAALDKKKEELQELLTQEEQKSASLREKLNVAVRKGKSLVQQRDSLKQALEDMTNKLELLKSEISLRENTLSNYERKIRDLSTYPEMVESLESERLLLRNRLTETEHLLQEREHILNVTMNTLSGIDVSGEVTMSDPVLKLEQIGKQFHDLHEALASSEQESRKSRKAAELLLAELNEVQERNDVLQEELEKAACELSEISQERDIAETAQHEALSRLEKLSTVSSERKQKQYSELMVLKAGVNGLKKGFLDIDSLLADVFSKDLKFLHSLEAYVESCLKQGDATDVSSMPILGVYGGNNSSNSVDKDNILFMDSWSGPKVPDHVDDSVILEVFSSVESTLQELKSNFDSLRVKLYEHPKLLHDKANNVFKVIQIFSVEITSQKKSFEALKRDIMRLESIEKEKDSDVLGLRRNVALLYEACANSIMEIENRKAELVGEYSAKIVDGGFSLGGQTNLSSEEFIKAIADKLLWTLKDFAIMKTEFVESNLKEMKTTIARMQRELQEKDIQKDRICMELVSQIKEAETAAQSYLLDLQSVQTRVHDMEQQMKTMEEERSLLEKRLKELQDEQAALTESKDRVRSLSDILAAKDQEIEALTQALDEEEIQMDEMKSKLEELEKVLHQKSLDLENLEASRGKIAKRLSVTVSKFDELHHMSEALLGEVENLQSKLQDRDAEISFLRHEVTRCTNDALVASQMSNKGDLDEIQEFLSWFDAILSQVRLRDMHLDKESSQVHEYKEILQKKISGFISEFEELRMAAESRDALLQVERKKVQELTCREEILQNSLREKEAHINMLEEGGDSGQATGLTSEILEVEPVVNKWAAPGPSSTSQVRSLRKVNNNDQVAIAIDVEPSSTSDMLEDEDDNKVHGFRSLTTSRIIPKFTRPITDMIDGLWVSCDRALMRQPALRLSIILYWAVLHTLLASFVF